MTSKHVVKLCPVPCHHADLACKHKHGHFFLKGRFLSQKNMVHFTKRYHVHCKIWIPGTCFFQLNRGLLTNTTLTFSHILMRELPMSLWGLVTLGMVDPARTFHTVEKPTMGIGCEARSTELVRNLRNSKFRPFRSSTSGT